MHRYEKMITYWCFKVVYDPNSSFPFSALSLLFRQQEANLPENLPEYLLYRPLVSSPL